MLDTSALWVKINQWDPNGFVLLVLLLNVGWRPRLPRGYQMAPRFSDTICSLLVFCLIFFLRIYSVCPKWWWTSCVHRHVQCFQLAAKIYSYGSRLLFGHTGCRLTYCSPPLTARRGHQNQVIVEEEKYTFFFFYSPRKYCFSYFGALPGGYIVGNDGVYAINAPYRIFSVQLLVKKKKIDLTYTVWLNYCHYVFIGRWWIIILWFFAFYLILISFTVYIIHLLCLKYIFTFWYYDCLTHLANPLFNEIISAFIYYYCVYGMMGFFFFCYTSIPIWHSDAFSNITILYASFLGVLFNLFYFLSF